MDDFRIIGLFGPAGSGKDVVADWLVKEKGFIKLAFADPMKRFAKAAFELNDDQLWGPSQERNATFKLREYWWFHAFSSIKTASNEIINDVLRPGQRVDGYLALMDWVHGLRQTYRDEISARVILQTLGTEWGRKIDELLWPRYAYEMVGRIRQNQVHYTQQLVSRIRPILEKSPFSGVVISDHRFLNEVESTQKHGGIVLRLRRKANDSKEQVVGIAGHKSETEGKTIPDSAFDVVLEFEEGLDKVYETLKAAYEEMPWKRSAQLPSSL